MSFDVDVQSRLREGPEGLPVMNMSGMEDSAVFESSDLKEVASRLSKWVDNARSVDNNHNMFNRGTYTPPENPYEEMRAARMATAHDEIVGGVQEITESFAFQGMKWEGEDPDEADIMNQVAEDIDLDSFVRKMWLDTYTFSQCIVGMIWGWREYRVRGKTKDGNRRKKTMRVWCPVDIRTIDPMKVVPVGGSGPFGGDLLAWSTTNEEMWHFGAVASGERIDPLMQMFFLDKYVPNEWERFDLDQMGVDSHNLLLMNPDMVWRHTFTRRDYERFPDVRLKNIFPLLDMKRHLLRSDRATLIGMANYILLIRKGDENQPAKDEEIRNLKENYNFIAKLPVIISDHRLEIDIIAPSADFVLQGERYDTIDQRIMTRLLNTLSLNGSGQRNEDQTTLARAVSRGMMNRRYMMKRAIERNIGNAVFRHPRNEGKFTGSPPKLVFIPRTISLTDEPHAIQAMMNLRTQRELSRGTILEQFDLDQETEAQRRELEEEQYDDIFKTHTPYDSPEGDPSETGPEGGRPQGGGSSPADSTKV